MSTVECPVQAKVEDGRYVKIVIVPPFKHGVSQYGIIFKHNDELNWVIFPLWVNLKKIISKCWAVKLYDSDTKPTI